MKMYEYYYIAEVLCDDGDIVEISFGCDFEDDIVACALQTANDEGYRAAEVISLGMSE